MRLHRRRPSAALQACVQQLAAQQVIVGRTESIGKASRKCMRAESSPPPPARCRRRHSCLQLPIPLQSPARCSSHMRPAPAASCLQAPTPTQHLAALQQLLVQPECTLPAATLFRPVLLKAVAAMVQAAVVGGGSGDGQQGPSPELAVALITVLELAPHVEG